MDILVIIIDFVTVLPDEKANDEGDGPEITAGVGSTVILVLVKDVFVPWMSAGEEETGRCPGVKIKLQLFPAPTIEHDGIPSCTLTPAKCNIKDKRAVILIAGSAFESLEICND